jgi:hypothetical protein
VRSINNLVLEVTPVQQQATLGSVHA